MLLSLEVLTVLHKLAVRVNPNHPIILKYDFAWLDPLNYNFNYCKCLICNQPINWGLEKDHGMDHAKETNLLPFV